MGRDPEDSLWEVIGHSCHSEALHASLRSPQASPDLSPTFANRCAGEPVSRVLSRSRFRFRPMLRGQPFIWARDCSLRSSDQPGSLGAKHPCLPCGQRETPMRSCSGWGLPCGRCCQNPGALLPHPFTLACARLPAWGRQAIGGLLSVALSLAPACTGTGGRYPPPLFRGARTFLEHLAAPAAARLPGTPLLESMRPTGSIPGRGRAAAGTGSRGIARRPARRSPRAASAAGTPRPPCARR